MYIICNIYRENKTVPKTHQAPLHPRAFTHAVPSVWNGLSLPNIAHTPDLEYSYHREEKR